MGERKTGREGRGRRERGRQEMKWSETSTIPAQAKIMPDTYHRVDLYLPSCIGQLQRIPSVPATAGFFASTS